MNNFFVLATVTMFTVKMFLPIFIAAVVRETYSLIKITQPISPNYNWENGVKQINITEENLSQSCILCQLLRTKTLASGSKCIKHFFYFYTCLPYLASLCSNPLNLKNKITKIEHKKIFCGPSKILKNISWLINIRLKYSMTPRKTLWASLLHT